MSALGGEADSEPGPPAVCCTPCQAVIDRRRRLDADLVSSIDGARSQLDPGKTMMAAFLARAAGSGGTVCQAWAT